MKSKEDFIKFYNQEYKKIINTVFQKELSRYNKIKLLYIIKNIMFLMIPFLFFFFIDLEEKLKFFVTISLLILVVLLIFLDIRQLKIKLNKLFYYINRIIYMDLLLFITNDKNISYYPNTVLDIKDFNQMNLFNLDLLYYDGKNFTNSFYLNKSFVFCDITLSIIKEKVRQEIYYEESINTEFIYNIHEEVAKNVFDGLYYETTIDRDNNEFIYLIPNNFNDKYIDKNIYKYIKYKGEKVELENLDLSIKYEIFSVNEHQSRYVLTPLFMEKINHLDKLIPNKKYIVFKEDGRVGIFIDDFSIEKILNNKIKYKKKCIDKKYLINYFNSVNSLFKISQILKYERD